MPLFPAVNQAYFHEADNAFAIVGNDALFRCQIPSFVSDLVEVVAWVDNKGGEWILGGNSYGS